MKYLTLLILLCSCSGKEFHIICDFITGEEELIEKAMFEEFGPSPSMLQTHSLYNSFPEYMPGLC